MLMYGAAACQDSTDSKHSNIFKQASRTRLAGLLLLKHHLSSKPDARHPTLNLHRTSGLASVALSQPAAPPSRASFAYVGETVVTTLENMIPPCAEANPKGDPGSC